MQIKSRLSLRDSILAAPIVLDLVLFFDLAQRAGEFQKIGIQDMVKLLLQVSDDRARTLS